ncbi:ROK family protein [Corynebacterium sp. S7]
MSSSHPPFSRLRTPVAKCLHLIRLNPVTSRSELVEATGLSQPTITRAMSALIKAGYAVERNDLTRSQGRGRPTIPLEIAETHSIHAGIAVGTTSTYIALFDIKGHTLRDTDISTPVAALTPDDFVQHIMAGLNRLTAGMDRPISSVGVTTSGTVSRDGVVNASNLGWKNVNIAAQLREQFSVPVTVSGIVPGIIGSEIQSSESVNPSGIMSLFADDSIGAAVSGQDGVTSINIDRPDLTTDGLLAGINNPDLHTLKDAVELGENYPASRGCLDRRATELGSVAAELIRSHSPSTFVVAGSAFLDDPQAPGLFARQVRASLPENTKLNLRMIPTHREVVRDIARAVALDYVLHEPLSVLAT